MANDQKVAAWRNVIAQLQEDIGLMRSGRFTLWSKNLGEPRVDTTASAIAHSESVIRMYEQLIEEETGKL